MQNPQVKFLAHVNQLSSLIKESLPEIAFIGRSNAGKSSLINALLKQDVARTSSTPGRTQGLVFFEIDRKRMFVDFPGFGYAKVSKTKRMEWSDLTQHYFKTRASLKTCVWIFDVRRDFDELDDQVVEWLVSLKREFVFVFTKIDTLKTQELKKRKIYFEEFLKPYGIAHFFVSSKKKQDLNLVWKYLMS